VVRAREEPTGLRCGPADRRSSPSMARHSLRRLPLCAWMQACPRPRHEPPPWTTSRRGGRDFCFSTKATLCAAGTMLTAHPGRRARACAATGWLGGPPAVDEVHVTDTGVSATRVTSRWRARFARQLHRLPISRSTSGPDTCLNAGPRKSAMSSPDRESPTNASDPDRRSAAALDLRRGNWPAVARGLRSGLGSAPHAARRCRCRRPVVSGERSSRVVFADVVGSTAWIPRRFGERCNGGLPACATRSSGTAERSRTTSAMR
jgi:hypothetical protein